MAMPPQKFWKSNIGKTLLQQNITAAAECSISNFWMYRRIVERVSQEEVTVDYANDLDTKK